MCLVSHFDDGRRLSHTCFETRGPIVKFAQCRWLKMKERRDRSFPGPVLDGSFGSEMDGEGARRTFLWEFPIPAFAWSRSKRVKLRLIRRERSHKLHSPKGLLRS